MTYNERSSNFCRRIYKGIKSAISSHEDGHPPTARTHTVPRTMAAGTTPMYRGVDDIETFMQWLYDFLRFLNTHPPMGKTRTHHRVAAMQSAMAGPAKTWFNTFTRPDSMGETPKFLNTICRLMDAFISPAVATKAKQRFRQISYNEWEGIAVFIHELRMTSSYNLLLVTENTLCKRITEAIQSRKSVSTHNDEL